MDARSNLIFVCLFVFCFQGDVGDRGKRGPRGTRGECGAKGEPGEKGPRGEPVRITTTCPK